MEKKINNWFVVTGAFSSGKTALIDALKDRGYTVVPEVARAYIDARLAMGESIEDIRKNEKIFQDHVLALKIGVEKELDPEEVVFFDRGIPDTYAYNLLHGDAPEELLISAAQECSYKKVFLLESLPFEADYARVEPKEKQKKLEELLGEAYHKFGFPVLKVPVMPVEERADFVLNNL